MHNATITESDARILAARHTLTERFAALEDRVTGSVERAADTVDHVSSEVRGTVNDAAENVRDLFQATNKNLREFFDVSGKVREHPMEGLLLAVGAGFAAHMIAGKGLPLMAELAAANPISELFGIARREIVGIGETAVAAASKKLRENINTLTLPSHI